MCIRDRVLVAVVVTLLRTEAVALGKVEIVILPFDDQSGNGEVGSVLASRLIQELEGTLVRLDGVEIISHREAAPLIAGGARLSAVAATLGADCLLQGTLLSGDRLNVQLLQGEGARLHWNFTFSLGAGAGDFDSESAMLRLIASAVELWRGTRDSLEASHFRERGEATAGEVDAMSGDLEMATYLFQQALEMDPGDAEAHAALSQVYYQLLRQTGDRQYLDKVRRHADRALEIDPDHVEAHIARGRYLRFEGAFEESIAELERAVALAPTSDLALFELAVTLRQGGKLEEAVKTLERAVELRGDYWFYKDQLATMEMNLPGGLDRARRLLEEAVKEAGPRIAWPLNNWGGLEIYAGNFAHAVALLERIPASSRDAQISNNLGTAYFYSQRYEDALAQYLRAAALDPMDGGYNRGAGDTLWQMERREEASAQYRQALEKLQSEQSPAVWRRALYLAKVGACNEALSVSRETAPRIAQEAWAPLVQVELAKTYAVCRDPKGAMHLLRLAVAGGVSIPWHRAMEFEGLSDEAGFADLIEQTPN